MMINGDTANSLCRFLFTESNVRGIGRPFDICRSSGVPGSHVPVVSFFRLPYSRLLMYVDFEMTKVHHLPPIVPYGTLSQTRLWGSVALEWAEFSENRSSGSWYLNRSAVCIALIPAPTATRESPSIGASKCMYRFLVISQLKGWILSSAWKFSSPVRSARIHPRVVLPIQPNSHMMNGSAANVSFNLVGNYRNFLYIYVHYCQ